MKKPFILLTNDDGINAQGISALAREIRKIGEVIIVSSEASGKLLRFSIEEGDRLEKGAIEALVDTTQLH